VEGHDPDRPLRLAVVGHVEWVEFARVARPPRPGEILHVASTWEEPAGGGGVAAAEFARLEGESLLFTALGDDDPGRRAPKEFQRLGVSVHAATRPVPSRRAFTFLDDAGERTITTIGERLAPSGSDPLPWDELRLADSVYFTAGDRQALEAARAARVLVATSRVLGDLAGIRLDALVGSVRDPAEAYRPGSLDPPPRVAVLTEGPEGGRYWTAEGEEGSFPPATPSGPLVDAYGAGDSFAAGLSYALAEGLPIEEALGFAAQRGALAMTRRGANGVREDEGALSSGGLAGEEPSDSSE
jgi:ribokinase